MDIKALLMQKNGIVLMHMAEELLGKQEGDRIETIVNLAEKFQVGRGTVQTAMKTLKELGAIDMEARGHMGTIITKIDYSVLLNVSGLSSIVGVMPLPYSKRYEGLATGIYNVLNQTNVAVHLAFMAGADKRLRALLDKRYDFVVASKLTALHYLKEKQPIDILVTLSSKTYVNDHSLIVRQDFTGYYEGMRIGVDYSSFDQFSMTNKYFQNKSVELVPLKYGQIIANLKNKKIDGAIWSMEERLLADEELKFESIHAEREEIENTQAVIIVRKNDVSIINFLSHFFDKAQVEKYQQDVLDKKIIPNY
ncbi:MAG: transcriptional regulator [Clostridia bacterium]|nr:transcriptional regulator [Clostridia bacterium]